MLANFKKKIDPSVMKYELNILIRKNQQVQMSSFPMQNIGR